MNMKSLVEMQLLVLFRICVYFIQFLSSTKWYFMDDGLENNDLTVTEWQQRAENLQFGESFSVTVGTEEVAELWFPGSVGFSERGQLRLAPLEPCLPKPHTLRRGTLQ